MVPGRWKAVATAHPVDALQPACQYWGGGGVVCVCVRARVRLHGLGQQAEAESLSQGRLKAAAGILAGGQPGPVPTRLHSS